MTPLFRQKALTIMRNLRRDFTLTIEDAAAIVGNLGHESAGFAKLQEIKPTIAGSRGGYGWAQWTGPRRRAFETWCKNVGLQPSSDEANYGFLSVELRGSEKAAIPATKKAVGLEAKVIAFEMNFERAGAKHYPSRIAYARDALAAYGKASIIQAVRPDSAPPVQPPPVAPASEPRPLPPSPPPATVTGFWESLAFVLKALFGRG